MCSGYDRENYEELYAIRARTESIDEHVKQVLSELQKLCRLLEKEQVQKSGHGAGDPTSGAPRQAKSPYRIQEKKKFGFL